MELYRDADEAERRRVYELYLWGLGELESPVRLPDWAAEAEPARGAAAMAGILDARLVRLAETLRSVRAADPQLPETLRDVIVRFREAIVRSAEERVVGPPAGPEEAGGPVLGAVAAFGAAREMAAAMRGGTIRIVTTVEEMRGDGVRVARVLQGFFAGEGGSVAQVIVVVPLAPGAPLPEASGVELPAEAFRPATAQAFPAVLALELASLRWTLERFAARVERMAGISGTAAWEPRPERRAVAALGPTDGAGSGTTIVFPEKSQEGTGSGPQPTQATTAEAASPSSEQAGERTPGTLTSGEAYGGAEPSAPAPPEGAAGTTARTAASAGGEAATGPSQRIEVTLADGSTVRADYVRADLRYRSLFGEVPVPLDRIRQYRDGVLTLGDGTAVKGEFGSGTLTVRTLFGEVTIDGAQIRALQWVEE
ncbi:hypothetical protein HRbin39_00916 [bacterium HR39]|nr:hypothetical protein HRbin39_00916 [bacterium HR39]